MKRWLACALCALWLSDPAWTHGVLFPNPPPTTDPAPGGTPRGPSGPSAPTTPATPSPSPSNPTGPSTPNVPTRPRTPDVPTSPSTKGGTGVATGGTTSNPSTGRPAGTPSTGAAAAAASSVDPTLWEYWWQYNQDRFLDLKSHIAALDVRTGDDARWLGNGNTGLDTLTADAASTRVVAALLGLLERERANDIVTSASIALARMADGPVAARAAEFSRAFAGFVGDPNQEIRETSVLARGLSGDEGAAFDLAAILAGATPSGEPVATRTRAFAAFGLGLLAQRSRNEDVRRFVVHHVVRTLREDRGAASDVHVACVLALGLAPLEWSAGLGAGLDAPDTALAARKLSSIATASRETELECLLATFADDRGDRLVRAHVPAALARLSEGAGAAAGKELTDVLLAALAPSAHEPDEVVQGCVLALGRIEGVDDEALDTRVRATLQRIALGGERQTRTFALIALSERGARARDERAVAETRAFLARRLAEGRSYERSWAALALGVLEHARRKAGEANSTSVRASLVATTKDCGSPDELGALATACGLAGDVAAVPVLLQKLERTSDPRLQGHLAVALGMIGDTRANEALKGLLAHARYRPELLRQAAIGLALLEDYTLVPTLIETLTQAQSHASQAAAASVIGWIGDRRAVVPLLALLENRDATASARGFAAVALGRVCDQDRLPWSASFAEDVHYRAATATMLAGDGTGLLEIL